MSLRTPIVLGLTAALLSTLPGCGGRDPVQQKADQIRPGMSLADVEKAFGPGEKLPPPGPEWGDLAGSVTMYRWQVDGRPVTVTFVSEKVDTVDVSQR